MNYRDEMNSTGPMVVTVAGLQGRSREGQAERSSRQTRDRRNTNGQRGRMRGRAGEQRRSPKTITAHQVESDGVRGQFKLLPGEISCARAWEKSAEAIVAMRPGESREERRAEEPTNWRKSLVKGPRGLSRSGARQLRPPPRQERERRRGATAASFRAKFEVIFRCETPESKVEGSTAGCGKPHVRWCGRDSGRNPAIPTRSRGGLGLCRSCCGRYNGRQWINCC